MNQSQKSKGGLQVALEISGDSHQYQKTIIFCFSIIWLFGMGTVLASAIMFNNPSFQCQGSEGVVVSQQNACELMKTRRCRPIENYSLTSELSLYCQRQSQRTILQSLYAIGAMVGLPIINLISDTRGRKKSLLISLSCLIVGSIVMLIGGLIRNLVFINIGQILCGTGSFTLFGLTFVISSDFCGDSLRQRALVIFSCFEALSQIFAGVADYLAINWKIYIYCFILAPSVLITTFVWIYIIESPYVLFDRNMRQQCLESILSIAQVNGRDTDEKKRRITQIVEAEPQKQNSHQASVFNVLRTVTKAEYLVPVLVLAFSIGLIDTNIMAMTYAMRDQGLGFAVNSALSGIARFVTLAISYFYIERAPRKLGIMVAFLFLSLIQAPCIWHEVHESYLYTTIAIILSKMLQGTNYLLLGCLQIECFPVQIQSTAAGIIAELSIYGYFIAPLIVEFGRQRQINPIALLGFSSLLGIVAIMFIKVQSYQKEQQHQTELN